jgi:hypothetical protein
MFGLLNKRINYPYEKLCSVEYNAVIASFTTYCNNCADPENEPIHENISIDNQLLGNTVLKAINLSRDLSSNKKYRDFFTREAMKERHDRYISNFCAKSGYKTKNVAFKNMMHLSISLKENKKLRILPTIHEALTGWGYFETREEDIYVPYESPPEIIGAAVRYAFSRCKGKGPYAKGAEIVTKALFPEGVPGSLEEYLESIDKDYKKWLVIDN